MLFRNILLFFLALAFLGAGEKPGLLKIDGLVTIDGNPSYAEIEINSSLKNGRFYSFHKTDRVGGNFKASLPLHDEYEIVVRVDNFPQQVLTVSALNLKSEGGLNIYADFTSPEYDQKLEDLRVSVEEKLKSYRKGFDAATFEKNYGSLKADQLQYQIQVAAFRFFENFNYNNVLGFPKIIRHTDQDQITRFTMGSFSTYKEAKTLLEKIHKDSLKDAFIIAVYKGEKKLLPQLVDENILK